MLHACSHSINLTERKMPSLCSTNAFYLLHPLKSDPRHLLSSGACLVFFSHKLLRMIRSVSCYFTRLHTGVHGNPGEWEEPSSCSSWWTLGWTPTHKLSHMEMGRGALCLRKEPWQLHWPFCGSPGPVTRAKPSWRDGGIGSNPVAAGSIGLHGKGALPSLYSLCKTQI